MTSGDHQGDGLEGQRRIQRAAVAMVLSACLIASPVVLAPLVFQGTSAAGWRLAAFAPLLAGLWLARVVRRLRARLRGGRGEP